jgi:hypothetical protein
MENRSHFTKAFGRPWPALLPKRNSQDTANKLDWRLFCNRIRAALVAFLGAKKLRNPEQMTEKDLKRCLSRITPVNTKGTRFRDFDRVECEFNELVECVANIVGKRPVFVEEWKREESINLQ